jgi:transcriptional regulator with XRE-family HTH domain
MMPGPLSKALAGALRDALKAQDVTQKYVAEEIGESPPQISKYLSADTTLNVEEFYAICGVLRLNAPEVLADAIRAMNDGKAPHG